MKRAPACRVPSKIIVPPLLDDLPGNGQAEPGAAGARRRCTYEHWCVR